MLCSNDVVGAALDLAETDGCTVCELVLLKPVVRVVKLEIVTVIVGREVSAAVVASSGS